MPKTLYITKQDEITLNKFHKLLLNIGFEIKDNQLMKHPTWLREKELDKAIQSLVEQLDKNGRIDLKDLRNQLAKDIACKGAIKANQQLSLPVHMVVRSLLSYRIKI